jgi:hypothetical protein
MVGKFIVGIHSLIKFLIIFVLHYGLFLTAFLFVNLVQVFKLNVIEIFADQLFTFKVAYVNK